MKWIETVMRWLFPAHYAETAICKECDYEVSKTRMVHTIDGYFCNDACADKFWWRRQW